MPRVREKQGYPSVFIKKLDISEKYGMLKIILSQCAGRMGSGLPFPKRLFHTEAGQRLLLLAGMSAYFAAAFFLMEKTGIGCVFLHFFGIPCPGCGMTRALRCLLQLDFAGAFRHHPLVFAMPYVFAYIFLPARSRWHPYLLAAIGAIAVMLWVYRIVCVSI